MSKIIAVTSGKGGTGKSSVCAGLGYTLAKQGHRTLLIELDFGLRCLDIMFGVENEIKYDLGDVLAGRKTALDAVQTVPMANNLSLLCAPKTLTSVSAKQIVEICRSVKKYFEYIIIDTGAGINSHVLSDNQQDKQESHRRGAGIKPRRDNRQGRRTAHRRYSRRLHHDSRNRQGKSYPDRFVGT